MRRDSAGVLNRRLRLPFECAMPPTARVLHTAPARMASSARAHVRIADATQQVPRDLSSRDLSAMRCDAMRCAMRPRPIEHVCVCVCVGSERLHNAMQPEHTRRQARAVCNVQYEYEYCTLNGRETRVAPN